MRIRLFAAVIALVGCAAVASAQPPVPTLPVPTAPPLIVTPPAINPPGMTPIPLAPPVALPNALPPAYPSAPPPIVYANPTCYTPAVAAAPCAEPKHAKRVGLFGRLGGRLAIGEGTANPVSCGCLAAERTLMFGGCKQFFTPGKTCCGGSLEYGNGGMGTCDNCKHVTSFLNR